LNPGRRGGKPVTNRLSYGAAQHVGFVVDEAALDQISFEYFGFSRQSSCHQFLQHHNHPGLAQ
jgi:hypothetical protein